MRSGNSTAVEHLPHHPKVKGSNPASAAVTGRQSGGEKLFYWGVKFYGKSLYNIVTSSQCYKILSFCYLQSRQMSYSVCPFTA